MSHNRPLRLYFVRHGQTLNFAEPPFNGWSDAPLTPYGRQQLDRVAEALGSIPFEAVYSSDLSRAVYGGEKLAARAGVPLVSDKIWREVNFGRWEGWTYSQIAAENKDLIQAIFSPNGNDIPFPDGGESPNSFTNRVKTALQELQLKHQNGGRVALVAHGGVCKALWGLILKMPSESVWSVLRQDFAAVNVADIYPDGYCVAHLFNGYVGPEGYFQTGEGFERLLGQGIFD